MDSPLASGQAHGSVALSGRGQQTPVHIPATIPVLPQAPHHPPRVRVSLQSRSLKHGRKGPTARGQGRSDEQCMMLGPATPGMAAGSPTPTPSLQEGREGPERRTAGPRPPTAALWTQGVAAGKIVGAPTGLSQLRLVSEFLVLFKDIDDQIMVGS